MDHGILHGTSTFLLSIKIYFYVPFVLKSSFGKPAWSHRKFEKQVDKHLVARLFTSYCKLLHDYFRILLKIISSNTKRRNQILNFVWNTWKYWWNETDTEIFPVFPQFLSTLKLIFSRSHGKLFSLLLQASVLALAWRKCFKDYKIL